MNKDGVQYVKAKFENNYFINNNNNKNSFFQIIFAYIIIKYKL